MPNNKYNIEMIQGSTFELYLTVKESNGAFKDLSGYTASMQIRSSYSSSVVTETLSTSNGEIVINTSSSSINLKLPAARTAAIKVDMDNGSPPRSKYVYDLELETGGDVSKLIFGDVNIYGEVTR